MAPIVITMKAGKVTKNGFVRFEEPKAENDPHSKNLYLSPGDVKALSDPQTIKVTVEAA